MHGFAFNVNTDLSYFGRIIPCGIFHKGVTSLAQLLGKEVDVTETKKIIAEKFGEVFQTEIEQVSFEQFVEQFHIQPEADAHLAQEMEKEHASN